VQRAPELGAIRTFGWRETALSRLVITKGAIIGLVGSLAGAALGLAAAAQFAGQLPATLYLIAGATVAGGLLVTTTAACRPAPRPDPAPHPRHPHSRRRIETADRSRQLMVAREARFTPRRRPA
jgi:hypothetical protein